MPLTDITGRHTTGRGNNSETCLDRQSKTLKTHEHSLSLGTDSNPGRPEYETLLSTGCHATYNSTVLPYQLPLTDLARVTGRTRVSVAPGETARHRADAP